MGDDTTHHPDGRPSPATVFSAIGNETRLSILQALWDAPDRPVSFTDLYGAVGMRDSAQFNYHLRRLTDRFVRKTDGGYDLSDAGKRVMRALLVGAFAEHPGRETIEVGGTCIECGAGLRATYDEHLSIECPECDRIHSRYPFPPVALVGRTDAEVIDAYNRWTRGSYGLVAAGVCSECAGAITTTVSLEEPTGEEWTDEDDCPPKYSGYVSHACEQCRHRVMAPVGMSLLARSDVVGFYRDHGIDLAAVPYWELDWCVSDRHATVLSADPLRIRVRVELDDEELRVTVDDALAVRDVQRGPRSSADGEPI